ncbi:MAG: PAS domain-containing protein [Desulfofustis sp.]|jgi:PAS domain S-box-containing protein|nr:PAS domain-containing protein [Desulfofustis sp.]
MIRYHRNTVLVGLVLGVYTLLLVTPAYFTRAGGNLPETTLVGPAAATAALFCATLFALLSIISSLRKRIEALQISLDQRETELADIRFNLEQTIEKRTFEISVVNASLNREIAERLQAETRSKELQKQMELILNSAGEGIFGLDTNGKLTFVNTAASLMLGWKREEMIGKSHHDLVHHTHADGSRHDPEQCPIRQAFKDGIVHFSSDDVFWTKDGTCFPVEYVSTPIIEDSTIKGAVVVFRDQSTFS